MKTSCFRYLTSFLLLSVGPSCFAQAVTIRVINEIDGRPLQKQQVGLSLFYEKGETTPASYEPNMSGETDANGKVQFRIPEPIPAHFSVMVHLTSEHWRCSCWVMGVTQDLIQKGSVGSRPSAKSEKSGAPVKAEPAQILILARPFSFFERLLYPFLKQ